MGAKCPNSIQSITWSMFLVSTHSITRILWLDALATVTFQWDKFCGPALGAWTGDMEMTPCLKCLPLSLPTTTDLPPTPTNLPRFHVLISQTISFLLFYSSANSCQTDPKATIIIITTEQALVQSQVPKILKSLLNNIDLTPTQTSLSSSWLLVGSWFYSIIPSTN